MADTPKPPPNLRVAEDEGKECDTCTHYERGRCAEYPAVGHVDSEWVCDSFASSGREAADSDEVPPERQPKDLRDATVKVREHFRRVRQQQARERK